MMTAHSPPETLFQYAISNARCLSTTAQDYEISQWYKILSYDSDLEIAEFYANITTPKYNKLVPNLQTLMNNLNNCDGVILYDFELF